MDLTFQPSMQHQILLSPPDTSTTEHCMHFSSSASFFLEQLEIILFSSPGAYWTSSYLGCLSSNIISFCLFILFMQQEYWSGLLFSLPVDHILSEFSTMTDRVAIFWSLVIKFIWFFSIQTWDRVQNREVLSLSHSTEVTSIVSLPFLSISNKTNLGATVESNYLKWNYINIDFIAEIIWKWLDNWKTFYGNYLFVNINIQN